MGFNNREIERKFEAKDLTPAKTIKAIKKALKDFEIHREFSGSGVDYYWKAPNRKTADFVRIRLSTNELTVKHTDRENISNRVEIDVPLKDVGQTIKFVTQILGKPQGKLTKYYTVLSLEDFGVDISVYKVKGLNVTYVEVEARSEDRLDSFVDLIRKQIKLKLLNKSLYQLVIKQ